MNFEYRFPLFDELIQGSLFPLREENHADRNYLLKLEGQIVPDVKDMGLFRMSFKKWEHPKTIWYHRLIVGETFAYCNELTAYLKEEEENPAIRTYLRDLILDKHLTSCLQKLGEIIKKHQLTLQRLTNTASNEDIDLLCNCYIFQLLKVCLCKAYLEAQEVLADVVSFQHTESMTYTARMDEIPPVRTFLVKRVAEKIPSVTAEHPKQGLVTEPSESVSVAKPTISPVFISVNEVATVLGKDEKTVRRRLQKGEIPGRKDKNNWLIEKIQFDDYLSRLKTSKKK